MLSEKQQTFLNALFGEADGDFRVAMDIAGYSKNTMPSHLMQSEAMRKALLEYSKDYLALNAPKASIGIVNIIDEPSQIGAQNKLKAAEAVLDRAGIGKTEKHEVEVKSGLFILPAKDDDGEN